MKKILFIILSLLLSVIIIGCSKTENQIIDTSEHIEPLDMSIEEIAILFTKDILDENYYDAYNKYAHNEAMKKAVNEQKYKLIFKDLVKKSDELVEIKKEFTTKSGPYDIVSIPIVFEKNKINLNVVFDSQKYIGGVNIGEYQEAVVYTMPDTIIERELVSDVNGYKLPGTLTLPKEGSNFPCVILVHGSGASDRDETIYQNKPFRDIAWGLAAQGIAVYRYDKRNFVYGEELKSKIDATLYDETIDDAVSITKNISSLDEIDENKVYVLGHSLGGFSIPRIAENCQEANGFIIMSGASTSLKDSVYRQYEYLYNLDNIITKEEKQHLDNIDKEIKKLDNINDLPDNEIILGIYKQYWVDNINYDPIETAKSIEKNVLVLQGERDYQVTMEDYNNWKNNFKDADNWTFITYEKLNHLMMSGEGKATNNEYKLANTVDTKLINDIANWIKK